MHNSLITHVGESDFMLTAAERCESFSRFVTSLHLGVSEGDTEGWNFAEDRSLTRTTILPPEAHQADMIARPLQPQIKQRVVQETGNNQTLTTYEESIFNPNSSKTRTTRVIVYAGSVTVQYPEGHTSTTANPALIDSFLGNVEYHINNKPGTAEAIAFDPEKIVLLSLMTVAEMN